jgi:predicted GTPase
MKICGHWKKLRIEEVHKFYSVASVIKSIERKNEILVMYEARMSEMKNA